MSSHRQLIKAVKDFYQQLRSQSATATKEQSHWVLRTLLVTSRRPDWVNSGFVLPTVALVALVIVLLTTAILFRAFDRSKNASNVRVNQITMNAATPAIDRARAKLDALFGDPTLPRSTPSDSALYSTLLKDRYRLGDETRLKLGYKLNGATGAIQTSNILEQDETLKSAWKFPVDTDNDGKYDSYTIYAIYFRSPSRDNAGNFNRQRSPLDARTPPMDNAATSGACSSAAGFSSLVGSSNWYKLQSGNLGKSFFIYTVNVPVTQAEYNNMSAADKNIYQVYKGNKGFSALEFQQDRSRIPLANNAVWFENDLALTPGSDFLLNGRVHTNGNLLVGGHGGHVTLQQVSSKSSCFYNQENGLISIGGNVGTGNVNDQNNNNIAVTVDLYQGYGKTPNNDAVDNTNKSTNTNGGYLIASNDAAYNQRIAVMKDSAINLCTNCISASTASDLLTAVASSSYPDDIKNNFPILVKTTDDGSSAQDTLKQQIEIYLRDRTRRVPFSEVGDGVAASSGFTSFTAATSINPPDNWRQPLNDDNTLKGATPSVPLNMDQLQATDPNFQKQEGVQTKLGDRVYVGNNLPAIWKDTQGEHKNPIDKQFLFTGTTPVNWTRSTTTTATQRWRNTQIQALSDLGLSDRNSFWEQQAVLVPSTTTDNVGGVRIITGTGIYVDGAGSTINTTNGPFYPRALNSFLTAPSTSDDTIVWPDMMPMTSNIINSTPVDTRKGDLLMRATAVYHYKVQSGTAQEPIACVSSYYDPTNVNTKLNPTGSPWNAAPSGVTGKSNNGIVYDYPTAGRSTFFNNSKVLLQKQAGLKFINGRFVNERLKSALSKIGTATSVPTTGLGLYDYSVIDTALCSISILNGATPSTSLTNKPEHGAIREATFLDGREAKQIGLSPADNKYSLGLELRQPLEIRVTDIDLGSLASKVISSSEYLLPNSGIIYASRDDGLPDISDTSDQQALLSPTDFKLDPTRRPNGIRLINGATLARNNSNNYTANTSEKGLILVSNLPAYIRGSFNLHRTDTTITTEIQEFTDTNSSFYDRHTPNYNFACRKNRPGCTVTGDGDYWRAATIISDAMTLLSGNFQDGVRSDSDFDLNNNTGMPVTISNSPTTTATATATDTTAQNRLKNGFWEAGFVPNANWTASGSIYPDLARASSYINNGITPVQRRVQNYPEYLMEVCAQPTVDQCGSGDWYVDVEAGKKASDVLTKASSVSKAGTTAVPPALAYIGYPRRVAFRRNGSTLMKSSVSGRYIPIGIDSARNIQAYESSNSPSVPPLTTTTYALWFRNYSSASTTGVDDNTLPLFYYPPTSGSGVIDETGQPLLVPVLQINDAVNTPSVSHSLRNNDNNSQDLNALWLQQAPASGTSFNASFVSGNSPSRPGEDDAGLHNFVRFQESWNNITVNIRGSFIQLKRSTYATGPFTPIWTGGNVTRSIFNIPYSLYSIQNNNQTLPYYAAPIRKWGFDVGLLSEQPDLFAQRFTSPDTGRPNEFFREVGQDDPWVKTLLCAGQASDIKGQAAGTTYSNAVPPEYRPSGCPTIPND